MSVLSFCLAVALPTSEQGAERIAFAAALAAAEARPEVLAVEGRLATRRSLDKGMGALATDPVVQLRPGYRFSPSGSPSGVDASIGVQQGLNLEGWGGARKDAATAEQAALARRIAAVRRASRRQAAQAWIEAWVRSRELELRRRMHDDALTLMSQTERRFDLGMERRTQVAQARAFLAQSRLDLLDAEGRLFDAGLALAAACGRGDRPLLPEGAPPELTRPFDGAEALDVARDPEVLAAQAEVEAASRREAEASAQDGWQLLAGVNLTHEPREQFVPAATLGITLPVSGRNRRDSSVRAANRAAAEHEQDATTLAMRRLRIEARHEVEHSHAVHRAHAVELVPARREELEALRRELELGAAPLQQVLDARIRLLDAELAAAHAHGRRHVAAFDLWLILATDDGASP